MLQHMQKEKFIKYFTLIPLCSMLTARAKHANNFEIVETHAFIAVQFDWKRERTKERERR